MTLSILYYNCFYFFLLNCCTIEKNISNSLCLNHLYLFDEIDSELNIFDNVYGVADTRLVDKCYDNKSVVQNVTISDSNIDLLHYNIRSLLPKLDL